MAFTLIENMRWYGSPVAIHEASPNNSNATISDMAVGVVRFGISLFDLGLITRGVWPGRGGWGGTFGLPLIWAIAVLVIRYRTSVTARRASWIAGTCFLLFAAIYTDADIAHRMALAPGLLLIVTAISLSEGEDRASRGIRAALAVVMVLSATQILRSAALLSQQPGVKPRRSRWISHKDHEEHEEREFSRLRALCDLRGLRGLSARGRVYSSICVVRSCGYEMFTSVIVPLASVTGVSFGITKPVYDGQLQRVDALDDLVAQLRVEVDAVGVEQLRRGGSVAFRLDPLHLRKQPADAFPERLRVDHHVVTSCRRAAAPRSLSCSPSASARSSAGCAGALPRSACPRECGAAARSRCACSSRTARGRCCSWSAAGTMPSSTSLGSAM